MKKDFCVEAECQCGFYISERRKKLWKAELDILNEFNRICDLHDIHYFFIGGSAIGVERHKGFIPWDDDLDIGMLRDEFEKFLKYGKKELDDLFTIQYGYDDINEGSWFCRIRKRGTTGIIRGQLKQKCNHGVFIELYPFDNVPNSKFIQNIQIELSSLFRQLLDARCGIGYMNKLAQILAIPFRVFSTKQLFRIYDFICRYFNRKDTEMVNTVSMSNYAKTGVCYYHKSDVIETEKKEFENTFVQVAKENDKILRVCYGDYMQLPPEEERGEHHSTKVYYDPDTDFNVSLKSGIPQRFFNGEYELGKY